MSCLFALLVFAFVASTTARSLQEADLVKTSLHSIESTTSYVSTTVSPSNDNDDSSNRTESIVSQCSMDFVYRNQTTSFTAFFTTVASVNHGVQFVTGIFFCFFGYRHFKVMVFFFGFFVAATVVYALCAEYLNMDNEKTKQWTTIGITVFAGIVGGKLLLMLFFTSIFLIGAMGGVALFQYGISVSRTASYFQANQTILYVCLAGAAVVFGLITLKMQKLFIILGTAIFGAFCVFSSCDYFLDQGRGLMFIKSTYDASITAPNIDCWFTNVTLGVIPLFFLLGSIMQYKLTAKTHDHRKGTKYEDQSYDSYNLNHSPENRAIEKTPLIHYKK